MQIVTGRVRAAVLPVHSAAPAHSGRCSHAPSTARRPCQYTSLKGRRFAATVVRAEPDDSSVQYNKEFGYSRKDVILIGVGLVAFGYALYYGLQAAGVEQLTAGNVTQLIIFVGLCVGWIGSYVYRVANKKMTYVTQLEEYEDQVMKKRLEEMPEEEVQRLIEESEQQKQKQSQQK